MHIIFGITNKIITEEISKCVNQFEQVKNENGAINAIEIFCFFGHSFRGSVYCTSIDEILLLSNYNQWIFNDFYRTSYLIYGCKTKCQDNKFKIMSIQIYSLFQTPFILTLIDVRNHTDHENKLLGIDENNSWYLLFLMPSVCLLHLYLSSLFPLPFAIWSVHAT